MVEKLFLHPAVLIASGYECLTSADVRFLNACNRHFSANDTSMAQIMIITPDDFELGGIFNPDNRMLEPIIAYRQTTERIPDFPYMNKYQILRHMYQDRLEVTFQQVVQELLRSIKQTLGYNDMNIANLFSRAETSSRAIQLLQKTDIYAKISALHKCGIGNRLSDAFAWVFYKYRVAHMD